MSVCLCLSICFWFSMSLYMGLSKLGGPKSILKNSVAKRDLNSTDGLETTRIFEIGHLSSLLRPTFLLFINLPENVFFANKFYSPTTDLPEVLSYILGFAMYDLPESSCRIFLEKPDGAILPQPICRTCCKLQWEWQVTTFLTLPSRVVKNRRHIYSKKRIFRKCWHLHWDLHLKAPQNRSERL